MEKESSSKESSSGRVKFWCQQEFCHIWRMVFFWYCFWLRRNGHNNGSLMSIFLWNRSDIVSSWDVFWVCFPWNYLANLVLDSSMVIPIGKSVASTISLPCTSTLCREAEVGISYHCAQLMYCSRFFCTLPSKFFWIDGLAQGKCIPNDVKALCVGRPRLEYHTTVHSSCTAQGFFAHYPPNFSELMGWLKASVFQMTSRFDIKIVGTPQMAAVFSAFTTLPSLLQSTLSTNSALCTFDSSCSFCNSCFVLRGSSLSSLKAKWSKASKARCPK